VEEERAVAMARRLHRTASRAGISDRESHLLTAAFDQVMARRKTEIPDPAHPEYLHPARTALILLDDAAVVNVPVLVAAIGFDSRRPDLTLPEHAIVELAGTAAVGALRKLPTPGLDDAALLETLVVAEPDELNTALAERLDHARHLHLGQTSDWGEFHRQVMAVYLPAARRGHPLLARRFGRWAEAFEWRFLRKLIR
jgi:hypothetical protein